MEKTKLIKAYQLQVGDIFIKHYRQYKVISILDGVITYSQFSPTGWTHKMTMGALSKEYIETISQTNKK